MNMPHFPLSPIGFTFSRPPAITYGIQFDSIYTYPILHKISPERFLSILVHLYQTIREMTQIDTYLRQFVTLDLYSNPETFAKKLDININRTSFPNFYHLIMFAG